MQLNMTSSDGQVIPVVITDVKDDIISLDANHQLAGHDLIFDLELMEIVAAKSLIIMP
jgi:peptidylprolyl isomerase